jgi:CDP-diacylglycerol--serine O-phosphatidyltransferase
VKKKTMVNVTALIPNIITLLAIGVGSTSVRYALEGQFKFAVILVSLACILDVLDGRIARMFKSTSDFGAELDSLADAINFGIVPSLIIYLHYFRYGPMRAIGWAVCAVYICCGVLRLARFNVQSNLQKRIPNLENSSMGLPVLNSHEDGARIQAHNVEAVGDNNSINSTVDLDLNPEKLDGYRKHKKMLNFFTGVPITVAAFLLLTPMILSFDLMADFKFSQTFLVLYMLALSLLMVSRTPTLSTKHIRIKRRYIPVFLGLCTIISLFTFIEPWVVLPIASVLYLLSIPITCYQYLRQRGKK